MPDIAVTCIPFVEIIVSNWPGYLMNFVTCTDAVY